MILVTGATGGFGGAAIDALLNKGVATDRFAALVRTEEKGEALKAKGVQTRIGDYNDYASLVTAFKGIEKLLFVSSSDIENRDGQHQNVINAAKEAGVSHIMYTSFERKNENDDAPIAFINATHIVTEKWIEESGVSFTFLKNGSYFENLPMFLGEQVIASQTIYLPAKEGLATWALRSEMAEATAQILTTEGHENKSYTLTNTEAYSFDDVAKAISNTTQKEIKYVSPGVEEYKKVLQDAGVPDLYVGMLSGFALAQAEGEFDTQNSDLEKLLGRKPKTLQAFIDVAYAQ